MQDEKNGITTQTKEERAELLQSMLDSAIKDFDAAELAKGAAQKARIAANNNSKAARAEVAQLSRALNLENPLKKKKGAAKTA